MQPVTGSEWCNHAHVGYMVAGAIAIQHTDGCSVEYAAPAVLVQVDCDVETVERLGLTGEHRHG